jgi:hypothetical protein
MNEAALHFVEITFEPISEDEMEMLLYQDDRMNSLFAEHRVLEYEGYQRGDQEFIMFFYGANADHMAEMIVPELKALPFGDRGRVLKRYGGQGAREELMKLT